MTGLRKDGKMKFVYWFLIGAFLAAFILLFGGCSDASVASKNLSTKADMFEIQRRIVFYNGITGEYMLEINGLCALGNTDLEGELSVVCKVGPDSYKKHFLGLSDNVTYFVEQIESSTVSEYFYQVVFKPSVIVPDMKVQLP